MEPNIMQDVWQLALGLGRGLAGMVGNILTPLQIWHYQLQVPLYLLDIAQQRLHYAVLSRRSQLECSSYLINRGRGTPRRSRGRTPTFSCTQGVHVQHPKETKAQREPEHPQSPERPPVWDHPLRWWTLLKFQFLLLDLEPRPGEPELSCKKGLRRQAPGRLLLKTISACRRRLRISCRLR